MDLRSKGKQLSFEILSSSDAFSEQFIISDDKSTRRKRKSKKKKKKSKSFPTSPFSTADKDVEFQSTSFSNCDHRLAQVDETVSNGDINSNGSNSTVCEGLQNGELRQRCVGGGVSVGDEEDLSCVVGNVEEKVEQFSRSNGRLETSESLDWKRVLAEDDPTYPLTMENSPIKYFMEEMYCGNSLRSTTTLGNEKERERVYDTIFRLPWRCELLIDVGFFVCLNSFLSLLTIMPMRALMVLWSLFTKRQFKKLSPAELSDFGCLVVLALGVALLECTDISLIYHMIRGQGTIKLYVVYNVLEIFDKLWQSFGGDVLQTLFSSADGLACSSPESSQYWIRRYTLDLLLAAASSIVHSYILLAQAITLSTCVVSHSNALLAMLVANNFAEIKSNVFKRFSKDNIHSIVYSDSIERLHITAFLSSVLAQNIVEAEGPWLGNFISNALLVYLTEVAIDVIKHSFIAKFNDIKPIAYSEFLEDLCKQTLNYQTDGAKRNLTFVPIAPACVVIRVLTPVYTARLPYCPLAWRLFWTFFLIALTYVMLASLKVMIGMGLQKHAAWYIKRCQNRKHHSD